MTNASDGVNATMTTAQKGRFSSVADTKHWTVRTRPIRSKECVYDQAVARLQADDDRDSVRLAQEALKLKVTVMSVDEEPPFAVVLTETSCSDIVRSSAAVVNFLRELVEKAGAVYDKLSPPQVFVLVAKMSRDDVEGLRRLDVVPYDHDPFKDDVDAILRELADEYLVTALIERAVPRKPLPGADASAWNGRGAGLSPEATEEFRRRVRDEEDGI